jgi:hypothetical protein
MIKKSILLLFVMPFNCFAQSNWCVEGEMSGALLAKSFQNVKPYGYAPDESPIPLSVNGGGLSHLLSPKLSIGIAVNYQLSRNIDYTVKSPIGEEAIPIGFSRTWDYISVPFNIKYNIYKKWSVLLQLSNSFQTNQLDRTIDKEYGWRNANTASFPRVQAVSTERFHSIVVGFLYKIPLKSNHNLLIKGFYDYVFLSAVTNSTPITVPNQMGIGLVYQIPNIFQKK